MGPPGPERAAQDPAYGGTIVQGFLQVSHLDQAARPSHESPAVIDKNFALKLRDLIGCALSARCRLGRNFSGACGLVQNRTKACCSAAKVAAELEDGQPNVGGLSGLFYWINGRLGRVHHDSAPKLITDPMIPLADLLLSR